MCGISGIIHFNNEPINITALEKINLNQHHRGPDGTGLVQMDQVAFGHNRLSIIDLEGGKQPFIDQETMITYNGEVYNYKEIRDELVAHYDFQTTSDTEVILKAYHQWGPECVKKFNGMFSFAIFDKKNQRVFIARDRFGIKPFYYFHSSKKFIFASELYPLMSSGEVPSEICPEAVRSFFQYQCVPAPLSIYKNVFKLQPGHWIDINLKTLQVNQQCYWSLTSTVQNRTSEQWLEELNSILDRTIQMQCRSDVAFGSFLSGGVDSSLVTALMDKHLERKVQTFSIGFNEESHCELPFAKQASASLRTSYHGKVVSSLEALAILNKLSIHFGEPFADSSAIPTYFVSREAATQVKMVLSGDGGDEVFAGYESYAGTFRDLRNPLHGILRYVFKLAAITPSVTPFLEKVQCGALRRSYSHKEKHASQRELFTKSNLDQLLRVKCVTKVKSQNNVTYESDQITAFQLEDIRSYLVDDVLTKVDRMSMANSLEVRVPLLDHQLVELAFSMPTSIKLKYLPQSQEIITKYILKLSASRFFDFNFLNRKKSGFGIPMHEWCKGSFKQVIEDNLKDDQHPIYEWVDFPYVQKLLSELFVHNKPVSSQVWAVLQFALWMKNVHQKFAPY